ncbi:MAG: hypothetical protein IJG30_02675, partial [Synergistaceae bacterium]|nr:hypothetical protein [Synergistaceae bacterium]
MKNTSATTRQNRKQTGSQNPTQNMRYTTKCMTQSALQKKILSLLQRACDKVAEAMNIVDEAGAIAGINVHFERGIRSEQDDHRGEHSRHSDGDLNVNWGSRYDQSNRDEADEIDDIDDIDYSDEIKEVTLPELADMVAERTCFKPECTLCVLNTAFDIMDEQKLMLDLGTISADTSDEDTEDAEEDADDSKYDEEDADTEDEETYAECGCHDCDNCRHYDDCYGKSDSEYDGYDENSSDDGDDEYNCEDGNSIDI